MSFDRKRADIWGLIAGIICFIFSEGFVGMFVDMSKDGAIETLEIGKAILRYNSVIYPLLSLNVVCNMTFQSIGQKWKSTFLSSLRQGIFFLPIVIIIPSIYGLIGVELAQAIADVLTFVLSILFFVMPDILHPTADLKLCNQKFFEIYNLYLRKEGDDYDVKWDDVAHAPYVNDRKNGWVVTYDDPRSIKDKCKYVIENNLGGIMFWSYGEDATGILMEALCEGLILEK